MKVLITGSRGMVGSNLLEHKRMSKYEVLAPTRDKLNLLDREQVKDFLEKERPDFVIHAAGKVGGIQANIRDPFAFLTENVDINLNLIKSCYELGIKRFLNLGSSCMYPRNAENPLKESMLLKGELEPTNEGYALAKIMAQRLCQYIVKENPDFMYKTLIPCNLYGKYDKFSPDNSHLVPSIIHKIHNAKMKNQSEVDIWGDGEARREFMYAGDLADCILKCLEDFDSIPDLMNVGLGRDYSVNEYYQIVAEVLDYKGRFRHDLSKPVGMKKKLVSTELLRNWGWSSQTSLHEGIQLTYQYYLSTLQ